MFGMWEEKGSSDTRLLLPPLIPDEYVMVGESTSGNDHREHVIPRNVICDRCYEMFAAGLSIETVATFIRKYLRIVRVSNEEQQRLDRQNELNLKQRMPDGWSFDSGNMYARLDAAGIRVQFRDIASA